MVNNKIDEPFEPELKFEPISPSPTADSANPDHSSYGDTGEYISDGNRYRTKVAVMPRGIAIFHEVGGLPVQTVSLNRSNAIALAKQIFKVYSGGFYDVLEGYLDDILDEVERENPDYQRALDEVLGEAIEEIKSGVKFGDTVKRGEVRDWLCGLSNQALSEIGPDHSEKIDPVTKDLELY